MFQKDTISNKILEIHKKIAVLNGKALKLEKEIEKLQLECEHPDFEEFESLDGHRTINCKECGKVLSRLY